MYKRIKELRLESNYSIEFIANYLGITTKKYLKLESDDEPKTKFIRKLAFLYSTSIDYIVEETDMKLRY